MSETCSRFISDKYKDLRDLNHTFMDAMVEDILEMRKGTNSQEAFRKKLLQYVKDTGEEAIQNQATKVRDAGLFAEATNRVFSHKKGVAEGLASLLRSTNYLGKDQGFNVESIYRTTNNRFTNYLDQGMDKGERAILRDRAHDREVIAAALSPDADVPTAFKGVAGKVKKFQQMILQAKRDAGIPIGEVSDYLVSQRHLYGTQKFRDIGEDGFVELMMRTVDKERTFQFLSADKHADYFRAMYQGILDKQSDMMAVDFSNLKNQPDLLKGKLIRRNAQPRAIHFQPDKFADAWAALSEKSILEAIAEEGQGAAREVAAYSVLGSQGFTGFSTIKQKVIREAEKRIKAGTLDMSMDELKELGQGKGKVGFGGLENLDSLIKVLDGSVDRDHSARLGAMGEVYRSLSMMRLLGKSTIAAVTDVASAISALSASTGQSYLRSAGEVFAELGTEYPRAVLEKFSKGAATTNRELAMMLDIAIEHGVANDLRIAGAMQYASENPLTGKGMMAMAKAQNFYGEINPIAQQARANRVMATTLYSQHLAKQTKNSWGEMGDYYRANMERAGITEADWDAFRLLAKDVKAGERKAFLVSGSHVTDIPDDVANAALAKNKEVRGAAYTIKDADAYRAELARKVSVMYDLFAQDAAPNPGARERAILTQGLQKGTFPGEFARSFAMLKSFSVKMMSIQQRMLNANPNGNSYTLAVSHVLGLSTFGYGSMVLNSIINNETPPDPTNSDTLVESMMRGGAGGYWADFLINNVRKGGASNAFVGFVGPIASDFNKAQELISKTANGDIKEKDIRDLSSYLPGNNHFALQAALKWTIADEWAEQNDPGHRARLQRRFQKRQGELWEQGRISE